MQNRAPRQDILLAETRTLQRLHQQPIDGRIELARTFRFPPVCMLSFDRLFKEEKHIFFFFAVPVQVLSDF